MRFKTSYLVTHGAMRYVELVRSSGKTQMPGSSLKGPERR
jgi:hypothetical protein